MIRSPAPRRRGLAVLAPLLVALGALPLLAPTCGPSGEGNKVFSRKSLIIPMDVCYQCTLESGLNPTTASCTRTGYTTPVPSATNDYQGIACPQTLDKGDAIKAYGLVYQLIRNGIAVYWIVAPGKDKLDDFDLTLQYSGGVPVQLYDWNTGGLGAPPTTAADHRINYMGGPFVVDGSDYDRASAILQRYKTAFADRADGTPGVNVHVSNVAFSAFAKKTMAGGWDAGGAVPPKLALLDIGSGNLTSTGGMSSAKNSEPVIQGYLEKAGIGSGTAGGTALGPHGEIYDSLNISDLQPSTPGGLPTTSRLFTNGYSILWIPHWVAPGSCSNFSSNANCLGSRYPAAQVDQALKTIGAFVGAGNDVFAECAGLGSLEGAFGRGSTSTSTYTVDYEDGASDGSTRFQTPLGVRYNELPDVSSLSGTQLPSPDFATSSLSSPLLQIGDFPFVALTGAIEDYRPQNTTAYRTGVERLIAGESIAGRTTAFGDQFGAWDYFTYRAPSASPRRGTVVYLAGHSYSGVQGAFQVAGSRLVLNTLFNLGAACTASGVACSTGQPGVCGAGTFQCDAATGQPVCKPTAEATPRPEVCNGVDDDCDWEVDEGLQTECYEAPAGYVDPHGRTGAAFQASKDLGLCRPGVSVCQQVNGVYAMSACSGQVLPAAESCNALDDDCDGTVDEALSRSCYNGPAGTQNVGECRGGSQLCQLGAWGAMTPGFVPGACGGEVLPQPERCDDAGGGSAKDDDCNGEVNNGCACSPGQTQACFSGPGVAGLGICEMGQQTCLATSVWGACANQTVASVAPEACVSQACHDTPACADAADTNCDGTVAVCPECVTGTVGACYGGDPGDVRGGTSQCTDGSRACVAGEWAACTGWVGPSAAEYCDGIDNDCDGTVDESATCPAGFDCLRGVCVPDSCGGTEQRVPEGYGCNPGGDADGVLVPAECGATPAPGCATGELCQYGTCIDPCPPNGSGSAVCAGGTVCGGGACIGGGCYETGCAAGQVCRAGACVADPCAGVQCPSGTFCREGDCVQACTFVSCPTGQKCGIDGFCEPDPCAGRTCSPGQRCTGGTCAADPCLGKGCAQGQICEVAAGVATCTDDPCASVICPVGVCSGGQCFSTGNPTGAGTAPSGGGSGGSSGGCGSGGGGALPALLGLLAVPLLRRRRAGAPGARLALALAAVALVASACKSEKDEFDPATCQLTCGEERCVDTLTDPSHCGGCETSCSAGEKCVDSHCGPAGAVAPFIRSLSPSAGAKDDPGVDVDVAGERFQAGATVRLATPLGARTATCAAAAGGDCQWLSAGLVRVRLDLSGAPTGSPWSVRVVNPDLVISNAVTFGVVVPIPAIAALTPSTVVGGTTATLLVDGTGAAGTGFTSGSTCRLEDVPAGEMALASALSGDDLSCLLDTATVPPGAYRLSVMSESGVRSNRVTLTVSPSDPVVYAIDPNFGTSVISFSVTGARFDATSRVFFNTIAVPTTTFIDTGRLFVSNLALPGTGTYPVHVQNGAGNPSNAVPFTVGGSAPTVTSFTPSTTYQGEPAVALTFQGTALPVGSTMELQAPGQTAFAAVAGSAAGGCAATCTSVTGTTSLVGQPDGTWLVRIRFPSPLGTSAPWPLRVLSNQAILRGYAATPAPAQAGAVGATKTSITFDVANIRGPLDQVRIVLKDPQGADRAVLDPAGPTTTSVTTLAAGPLALGGYAPGTYTFVVRNPNASDSNALPFAVTPGAPTLASVCVTGTSCTSSAVQGDTPLGVTLTGTNFAAADANGNGSTVMVAADFMTGFPAPDPCVVNTSVVSTQFQAAPVTAMTVVSPTEIRVQLDTRAAYAASPGGTTYRVSVWNPGGTSGPQKSGCGQLVDTLPGFTILP